MVDPSVITKRVEQIEKHLERIRPFTHLSQDAFLNDNVAQDVVEYNLFQIVAGVCPEYPPRPYMGEELPSFDRHFSAHSRRRRVWIS